MNRLTSMLLHSLAMTASVFSLTCAATDTLNAAPHDKLDGRDVRQLTSHPKPDPSLSPGDVVEIQMRALQANDAQDTGIRTTYRFASPANTQTTGPYDRFARMIKTAPYRAMLNATALTFGAIQVKETQALQEVQVVASDSQKVTYVFVVRRQDQPPYENCWMTDAVFTLPEIQDRDYQRGPPGFG